MANTKTTEKKKTTKTAKEKKENTNIEKIEKALDTVSTTIDEPIEEKTPTSETLTELINDIKEIDEAEKKFNEKAETLKEETVENQKEMLKTIDAELKHAQEIKERLEKTIKNNPNITNIWNGTYTD